MGVKLKLEEIWKIHMDDVSGVLGLLSSFLISD